MDLKFYQQIYNDEKFSNYGLNSSEVLHFGNKYGKNCLKKRKKTIFSKTVKALFEPMILILLFAWVITLGVCITNFMQNKEADFYECIGIFLSILVSVGLTVVMEAKSENAFELLKKYSESTTVKVIRSGKQIFIPSEEVVVGDVIIYEAGDKIVSDGLVIDCIGAEIDESMLTGESKPVGKHVNYVSQLSYENMVFSGTYLKTGSIKCITLAVGANAQTGKIASGLADENKISAPLSQKLNSLSKKISIFGAVSAVFVLILSILRLSLINALTFENVKQVFLDAIILIVAAVPEGLPATVAISLALSVLKLTKSNAIIKKLIAVETVGGISVICSDKTGTLTTGKMSVTGLVENGRHKPLNQVKNKYIMLNVALNSTAGFNKNGKKFECYGNFTEQALIKAFFIKNNEQLDILRAKSKLIERLPFDSKNKYMKSFVELDGKRTCFYKGTLEQILKICNYSSTEFDKVLDDALKYEKNADRLLAFAHSNESSIIFDGYVTIADEVRKDVVEAVAQCRKAGITVKIITGDDKQTALAVAKKIGLRHGEDNAINGSEIDSISDDVLLDLMDNLTVIARSTPETKLRIVNLLKKRGDIVAVTGDGVNDSPAMKNADIGIAMGSGSDVTKESADIILLDNSFSVIVKAITFGRNIYRNFQRFIFFQLTVNFSAVFIIISFLLLGFEAPFTAMQLLWINVIMDGPLALSLGLEHRTDNLLDEKPVRRTDSLFSKKTFTRTVVHSVLIVGVTILQKLYNFLNFEIVQTECAIFCMFVTFQLFNAINARELGTKSILKTLGKNKAFSLIFCFSLGMQILISELLCKMFNTYPLGVIGWVKILMLCSLIVIVSEIYKWTYKKISNNKFFKKIIKRSKFA